MTEFFQRYTAPDPAALIQDIERSRGALSTAQVEGNALLVIERAGELAGMLTTARHEAEARQLLEPLQSAVEDHLSREPAG